MISEATANQSNIVLLQTFNYKSATLEKQAGDLPIERPWVRLHWRGGWVGGRAKKGRKQNRKLIRSEFCTQESETTPAFSLIKNIFKSNTEHLWRESKYRGSAQRSHYKTGLKLCSWKECKLTFLFLCLLLRLKGLSEDSLAMWQGTIRIHFLEAIQLSSK